MFLVRIVFHTWKSGLLLFYRTENVRENTFSLRTDVPANKAFGGDLWQRNSQAQLILGGRIFG